MIFRFGKIVIAINESEDTVDRERSCMRKQKYKNGDTVKQSAIALTEKKKEQLEAYKCRYCDGWHIGHANGLW